MSGLPILVMTIGLLGGTSLFAYRLYEKRAFPWQHGHKLSNIWKRTKQPPGE